METFVNQFSESEGNIQEVHTRFNALSRIWVDTEQVQDQLEAETGSSQDDVRDELETAYYKLSARMQALLSQHDKVQAEHDAVNTSHVTATRLKLPTIELPTFEGDYRHWLSYEDTFTSLIHNNKDIASIQKFQYLRSSLKGEAYKLIQNLPITEANYAVAWKLLVSRYSKKKLIASSYIHEILHIKAVSKESAQELRSFVGCATSNLNAVNALYTDVPLADMLLTQHFVSKLDSGTRKAWELQNSETDFVSIDDLFSFLERRCQALESIQPAPSDVNKQSIKPQHYNVRSNKGFSKSFISTTSANSCFFCKEPHALFRCASFIATTNKQKYDCVRRNKLCTNCLSPNHVLRLCKAGSCKKCSRKHNTLLHNDGISRTSFSSTESTEEGKNKNSQATQNENQDQTPQASYCALKGHHTSRVLLSTAVVKVKNHAGQWIYCRALLDSGSQSHFASEELVQRLKLKKHPQHLPIQGINNAESQANFKVDIQLQSRISTWRSNIECSILPRLTSNLPSHRVDRASIKIPRHVTLADPTFDVPAKIDLLIGTQIFIEILKPDRITRSADLLILQNTELGWIVAGRIPQQCSGNNSSISCFLRTEESLHLQLQRFWDLEEIYTRHRTKEEMSCEHHYCENTVRDETGKFIVRLPLKESREALGDSLQHATKRFLQLEKRLEHQPELRIPYTEFMNEYEQLGHMVPVGQLPMSHDHRVAYYLPHHAVIKPQSSTTKVRVVFDGSAKTTSGKSLNDILMVGPTIQQDLFSIMTRFRTHPIAFTGDVEKMYRMIKVQKDDNPLQ